LGRKTLASSRNAQLDAERAAKVGSSEHAAAAVERVGKARQDYLDSLKSVEGCFSAREIVNLWQDTYQPLSAKLRRELLGHPKLKALTLMPREIVRNAVLKHRKLEQIFEDARLHKQELEATKREQARQKIEKRALQQKVLRDGLAHTRVPLPQPSGRLARAWVHKELPK